MVGLHHHNQEAIKLISNLLNEVSSNSSLIFRGVSVQKVSLEG